MKKYYKLFLVLLLIFIVIPQVALAFWWNPFSWSIWGKIVQVLYKTDNQVQTSNISDVEIKIDEQPVENNKNIEPKQTNQQIQQPNNKTQNQTEIQAQQQSYTINQPNTETNLAQSPPIQTPQNEISKNGWYFKDGEYSCCDDERVCSCQIKEYREYEEYKYSTIETKIDKYNCSNCPEYKTCKESQSAFPIFDSKTGSYLETEKGECKDFCENTNRSCGVINENGKMNCQDCTSMNGWKVLFIGKCKVSGGHYLLEQKEYRTYFCSKNILDGSTCRYNSEKCYECYLTGDNVNTQTDCYETKEKCYIRSQCN